MKGLYPTTVDTLVDVVINGKWSEYAGKIDTLGLISGEDASKNYVGIPTTTQFEDGKFTSADYAALVKAMFEGSLKVSNDISAIPATTNTTINDQGAIKG
jgi:basic membrane protein A